MMFAYKVNNVANRAKTFWLVESAWNNNPRTADIEINIHESLNALNDIILWAKCGDHIVERAVTLRDAIIRHGSKSRLISANKKNKPATIKQA